MSQFMHSVAKSAMYKPKYATASMHLQKTVRNYPYRFVLIAFLRL